MSARTLFQPGSGLFLILNLQNVLDFIIFVSIIVSEVFVTAKIAKTLGVSMEDLLKE